MPFFVKGVGVPGGPLKSKPTSPALVEVTKHSPREGSFSGLSCHEGGGLFGSLLGWFNCG